MSRGADGQGDFFMMPGKAKLPPFALERFFAQYEFSTRYVLCSSDPQSMPIRELLAFEPEAQERFAELNLGYIDSRGSAELRRTIGSLYDHADEDRILVHSGAQEPIFAFLHAVLAQGDHAIVQFPAYQSHYSITESIGGTVTRWNSDLDRAGAPDIEQLERLIRRETRVLLVTTPNNPTGYQFSLSQFQSIVETARKHGLWLLVDEVYRGTEREADRLPAICDLYERGVSIGGLSKAYGLPGLRIGWIAAQDQALLERVASIKDYLTICNSAPSEFLAALALRHADELTRRVRDISTRNLNLLDEFFTRHAEKFQWTRPPAGTTAFPRYRAARSEAFCRRVAKEAGVLLLPSTAFDAGDAHLRVGYGRTNMPEALAALDGFLDRDHP